MSIDIGDRRPLVMTSGGVSILIALPPAEMRDTLKDNLRAIAAMGRNRVRHVREMVRHSIDVGFGINQSNTAVGISGFGIALRDTSGAPFAALSVAAPAATFADVPVSEIVAGLREEAQLLERASSTLKMGETRS